MYCIHTVYTHSLNCRYKDLPVLIVKNWTDVTPQLLEQTYNTFRSKTWDLSQLYNSYWEQRIYKHREQLGGAKGRLMYNRV